MVLLRYKNISWLAEHPFERTKMAAGNPSEGNKPLTFTQVPVVQQVIEHCVHSAWMAARTLQLKKNNNKKMSKIIRNL